MNKQHFLLAVSFLTRFPIHFKDELEEDALNEASGYFALVGVLLGLGCALVYTLVAMIFPSSIAVIFTIAAGLLATGAFHEDGFADVWDGFGGGWGVSQKLHIMKDSRLGTYGASALVILLLLKFQLLLLLSEAWWQVVCALILAHGLSRVMATSMIGSLPYVQEDANSKVKPVAQSLSRYSRDLLYVTGAIFLLVSWLLTPLSALDLVTVVMVLAVTRVACMEWFKRQLGGYTGDCLGAAQQCGELAVYLTLVSILL